MSNMKCLINEREAMKMVKEYVAVCGSQKDAARMLSISPQFLCDVLKGFKQPYSIMVKLGWEKVVYYKRIGQ